MWHFTTLAEQNMQLDGLKMISVIESMSRWQKQQGNTPASYTAVVASVELPHSSASQTPSNR